MKNCLIVTDFQSDFVTGTLGFPGAELLEPHILSKIKQYRERGDEVLFTFDTHFDDYLDTQEGKNLPVAHCVNGSEGHGLYGKVADELRETDRVFHKNTFGSDELFEYLKAHRFKRVELVGLVTNICVLANAVLAKTAQPETPIIVDKNCVASFDDDLHEAALKVMVGLQVKLV